MASPPVFSMAGWKWLVQKHPVVSLVSAGLGLYVGVSTARKITSPDHKKAMEISKTETALDGMQQSFCKERAFYEEKKTELQARLAALEKVKMEREHQSD